MVLSALFCVFHARSKQNCIKKFFFFANFVILTWLRLELAFGLFPAGGKNEKQNVKKKETREMKVNQVVIVLTEHLRMYRGDVLCKSVKKVNGYFHASMKKFGI